MCILTKLLEVSIMERLYSLRVTSVQEIVSNFPHLYYSPHHLCSENLGRLTDMRMCFCFVLLSLAIFYLFRVISCRLLLRVLNYLAIIVTIFTIFFLTHACAHLHSCRRAHALVYFFSLAPILRTSAYVVLIFPRGRVVHTRICVSAFVPLRICVCFLISFR